MIVMILCQVPKSDPNKEGASAYPHVTEDALAESRNLSSEALSRVFLGSFRLAEKADDDSIPTQQSAAQSV